MVSKLLIDTIIAIEVTTILMVTIMILHITLMRLIKNSPNNDKKQKVFKGRYT